MESESAIGRHVRWERHCSVRPAGPPRPGLQKEIGKLHLPIAGTSGTVGNFDRVCGNWLR